MQEMEQLQSQYLNLVVQETSRKETGFTPKGNGNLPEEAQEKEQETKIEANRH